MPNELLVLARSHPGPDSTPVHSRALHPKLRTGATQYVGARLHEPHHRSLHALSRCAEPGIQPPRARCEDQVPNPPTATNPSELPARDFRFAIDLRLPALARSAFGWLAQDSIRPSYPHHSQFRRWMDASKNIRMKKMTAQSIATPPAFHSGSGVRRSPCWEIKPAPAP